MMIIFIINLNSLAREAIIPDYEKLPKSILFRKLQESYDLERLQRAESRRKRILDISNKKRMIELEKQSVHNDAKKVRSSAGFTLNKLDPIMLCPVEKKNIWKFVRPNGKPNLNIQLLLSPHFSFY